MSKANDNQHQRIKFLRDHGYENLGSGRGKGDHDIYHDRYGNMVTLDRHVTSGTWRAIKKRVLEEVKARNAAIESKQESLRRSMAKEAEICRARERQKARQTVSFARRLGKKTHEEIEDYLSANGVKLKDVNKGFVPA